MELREKVAREIALASGASWIRLSDRGDCGRFLAQADAILAIPELQEALHHVCRDQEILSPEQVRQVGLVYGGEPKAIRVTDD